MLVHSNTSTSSTPGSSTSTTTTLEPVFASTKSSSSQLHQKFQQSSLSSSSDLSQQKQQQMSCTSSLNFRPPSRAPSILDSPTLARVERARLRLEASAQYQSNFNNSCGSIVNTLNGNESLERFVLDTNKQSLPVGHKPVSYMDGPIKRGLLWQQRDRIFSRWKERYFVLTRDYLHCFKRASGSAHERASDMGQFIFKIKLVDVEKVEWLNRRSYSAISLLLGREGRVLLRCDEALEDWFEVLEECTITSKERRKALKISQGPRSRASLAAPISHASLQSCHFGLGGTYLSALDDWLLTDGNVIGGCRSQKFVKNGVYRYGGTNPFLFSDSVPDLSAINNENQNHISGMSTNHSTPQKIPYSTSVNNSRHSNGYASQNSSYSNGNGFHGSPRRIFINNNFGANHIVDEESEDGEVELRRPSIFRHLNTENGNEVDQDWLYRKPKAPTDTRHSAQPILLISKNNDSLNKLTSHGDRTNNDSGLDTSPSTHRPLSYRHQLHSNTHHIQSPPSGLIQTSAPSLRGTAVNSPGCSFKANLNQENIYCENRTSVQERILKIRNEEDHCSSVNSEKHLNQNEILYDSNQNRYNKNNNQFSILIPTQHKMNQLQSLHNLPLNINSSNNANNNNNNNNNHNNNSNNNNSSMSSGSTIFRERYQHPALKAIMNEAQAINFRDRSYSDCLLMPSRRGVNNNLSPLASRRNHVFVTPTGV